MRSLAVALITTLAALTPASTQTMPTAPRAAVTTDTLWLHEGALFGAYTLVLRPDVDTTALERFLRRDYFPAWANLIPGSRVYYLEGERGARPKTKVFFWIFESLAERAKYYPQDGVSTPEYRRRRATVDWLYADSTLDRHATAYEDAYTDFVIISKDDGDRTPWLRPGAVMGFHEFTLRPGVDTAAFERFLVEEFARAGAYAMPGAKPFFLKGDRGAHANGYGMLWMFESAAVRDRYFPAPGSTSAEYVRLAKQWAGLKSRFDRYVASWKPETQTDYRVIQ